MKDPKNTYLLMILFAIIISYGEAIFNVFGITIIIISYIIMFFCSVRIYISDLKTSNIRSGCMFEIISKHEKENVYFYLLQVGDHIYFVQGEMDLGEEGKEYVMGNHRGALKAFPV